MWVEEEEEGRRGAHLIFPTFNVELLFARVNGALNAPLRLRGLPNNQPASVDAAGRAKAGKERLERCTR